MSYYADKDFFEDEGILAFVEKMMSGELSLSWYHPNTEPAHCRPASTARGLTYEDCNVGTYGYDAVPEFVRECSRPARHRRTTRTPSTRPCTG